MRTVSSAELLKTFLNRHKLECLLKKSDKHLGHYADVVIVKVFVGVSTDELKDAEVACVNLVEGNLNSLDVLLKSTERALEVNGVFNTLLEVEHERSVIHRYEGRLPLLVVVELCLISLCEGNLGSAVSLTVDTAVELYGTADIHTLKGILLKSHSEIVKTGLGYGELISRPLTNRTVAVLTDYVVKLRVSGHGAVDSGGVIVGSGNGRVGHEVGELCLKLDDLTVLCKLVVTHSLVLLENLSIAGKVVLIKGDSAVTLGYGYGLKNGNELNGLNDHGLTLCLESDGTGTLCEVELEGAVVVTGGVLNVVGNPASLGICLGSHGVAVDILHDSVGLNGLNTILNLGNDLEVALLTCGVTKLVLNVVGVGLTGNFCNYISDIAVLVYPVLIKLQRAYLTEGNFVVNLEFSLNGRDTALGSLHRVVNYLHVVEALLLCRKGYRPGSLALRREVERGILVFLTEVYPRGGIARHGIGAHIILGYGLGDLPLLRIVDLAVLGGLKNVSDGDGRNAYRTLLRQFCQLSEILVTLVTVATEVLSVGKCTYECLHLFESRCAVGVLLFG